MKLFFCTNAESMKSINLKRLLLKSIDSALANTSFDVFLIYDGSGDCLGIGNRKMTIIEHRHEQHDILINTSKKDIGGYNQIITGAFLRTEIPKICRLRGITDEYALYCDYDVFFNKSDFSGLYEIRPKYLAAAPERDRNCYDHFNSGVLLMNIDTMFREDKNIKKYIRTNDLSTPDGCDQPMYNALYNKKFTRLPIEYNWKPYWGINHDAKIIHFHGAKPRSAEPLERYNLEVIKDIRSINIEGYEHYNKVWEDMPDH